MPIAPGSFDQPSIERRRAAVAAVIGVAGLLACRVPHAQPSARARLGIVEYGDPPDSGTTREFLAGLHALGWRDGFELTVERRFAGGRPDRIATLLREFEGLDLHLLFAPGHDIAKAAKTTLPRTSVVTAGSEDPVRSGLIESLARPGGTVTGVSFMSPELAAKRLQLLKEIVPALERVAVLREPAHVDTYHEALEAQAANLGVSLAPVLLDNAEQLEVAFASMPRAQAVFVVPSRLISLLTRRIVELAGAARLPAMSAYESFAAAGGLASYGASASATLRRAAAMADRVLRGTRPADVPFELPTQFVLSVNLRTARALKLQIPRSILLRADEVID